jgi:small nuclear ribonucleoprotein (snRNP)-like protein
LAIPLNTPVTVLMVSGEQVEGEVAMIDQATYLCLRHENETIYLPWPSIKCVRGPALPERNVGNPYATGRISGNTTGQS